MTPVAAGDTLGRNELSLKFLNSEFARAPYSSWTIERRLDAYLRHHQLHDLLDDATAYDRLMDCVMANIALARESGVLGASNPTPRAYRPF